MEKRGDPRDVGYVSRDPWGQRNSAEGEAFAAALVNTSIALPMVAWFVTLFAGAAFHDGPTRAASVYLPLLQYDRALVRFGPLLPLGPLFLRFFADRSDELAVPTPKRALVVYTMAAGVRLADVRKQIYMHPWTPKVRKGSLDRAGKVYTAVVDLKTTTKYTVRVAKGLKDIHGQELGRATGRSQLDPDRDRRLPSYLNLI